MATTFNIGTQNAANIQNIGGDAHIERIDATASFHIDELRASIASARAEAAQIELPPVLRDLVGGALDSAADEAAKDEPDRRRLAGFLWTAMGVIKKASSFVTGCAAVLDSLQKAVTLLGPVGHTALTLAAL
jgi:hypothetical protein